MTRSNSQEPLKINLPNPYAGAPLGGYGSRLIESAWQRIEADLGKHSYVSADRHALAREAFCLALYMASAAIARERADARAISETAAKIEAGARNG